MRQAACLVFTATDFSTTPFLRVHPDTLDVVYIGFEHAVHDALPPPGSAKRADKLLSYINRILPVGLCSFRWRLRP
ncbi:hypothetical protein [Cohnella cellulosilytica]|uniref:hypothetical protein n=1 Tax=Cohnella cellulosilytica TaxID=986710 RepID=UPI003618C259